MARTAQDRIARLLLEKTALSEEQLAMAREFRRKKGGDLGRILIRQKAIQEADLLQVLAEDFQLDLVTLLPQTSDVSFVNKLPISFSRITCWCRWYSRASPASHSTTAPVSGG